MLKRKRIMNVVGVWQRLKLLDYRNNLIMNDLFTFG